MEDNKSCLTKSLQCEPRKGEKFWGCPNFPKCRGARDIDEAAMAGNA